MKRLNARRNDLVEKRKYHEKHAGDHLDALNAIEREENALAEQIKRLESEVYDANV